MNEEIGEQALIIKRFYAREYEVKETCQNQPLGRSLIGIEEKKIESREVEKQSEEKHQ
jgi:hypothetical protein